MPTEEVTPMNEVLEEVNKEVNKDLEDSKILYHYKDLVKIKGESFYEGQTGMVVNAIKTDKGYNYSVIFMGGAAQEMFTVDQLEMEDKEAVIKKNAKWLDPIRNFFNKF